MKLIDNPSAPSIGTGVACDLTAFAAVQATADMLVELRHHPVPIHEKLLPASFLKHADDQTVAGLEAVLRAQQQPALAGLSFENWGVVGASRFLGRTALAAAMQRFAEEGAWGISPHLIPHRSLHSLSGTISQVLKIHGPNFGVGGGPHGEEDALLAATALLSNQQMSGVWVVLTGWDPEPIPDRHGNATQPHCVCHGVALALAPAARLGVGALRLRFVPQSKANAASSLTRVAESFNMFRLPALLDSLTKALTPASVVWQLASGGWIELVYRGTVAGDCSLNMVQPSAQKGWLEQSLFETSAEKKS